jgi:hypothetical protein
VTNNRPIADPDADRFWITPDATTCSNRFPGGNATGANGITTPGVTDAESAADALVPPVTFR